VQDLRYSLRTLRKNPGFTVVAVLTLALGIGANIAIFSLVEAVMLRYLPVKAPEELVQLQYRMPEAKGESSTFANPVWEQLRDGGDLFSAAFAWSNQDRLDVAQGGRVLPIKGLWISGGFFRALGLNAATGRLIADADDRRGCPAVAVLSYGFWQDHFGGEKSAVGSTLTLRNHALEVIGVAPRGFFGMEVGDRFEVALPICAKAIFDMKKRQLDDRNFLWLNVGGRIDPKRSAAHMRARFRTLSTRLFVPPDAAAEEGQYLSKMVLTAIPAASGSSRLRNQFSQPLQILMAVVGVVLLITCANVGSLSLARAVRREKEFSVRQALGASKTRLIRQLLTECILVSAGGAVLGAVFARWTAALLVRIISTAQNSVFLDLSFDTRIIAFVLASAGLTAVLFGLLPALYSVRASVTSGTNGKQYRSARGLSHFHLRKWIVGSQVALSLVLFNS
jgi:putative ABC transport system permease protein